MSSSTTGTTPGRAALEGLGADALGEMLAAGLEVRECLRVLTRADLNLVGECLAGQGTFYEFDHYPEGDVYDPRTHAQYYYHAHRGLPGEHGHFHTFMRAGGMSPACPPADRDEPVPRADGDEFLSHLVAISMNQHGFPIGMFTTNRWVTGETWFAAGDVIAMLDGFVIDHAYPSWPLNRWLGAMMRLFRPTVAALLRERDAAVLAWRARRADGDVFEDRDLEITSQTPISIDDQVADVQAAIAAAATGRNS